jgi:hypothetical protein
MTLRPGEIRVDKATGMVRPTHGPSLNTDRARADEFEGGAHQVVSLPDGLQVIKRGGGPTHFEIVPTNPVTPAQFQDMLNKVGLKK